MKKLSYLLMGLVMAFGVVVTSCSDDTESDPLEMDVTVAEGTTYYTGDVVDFIVTISSGEKLVDLIVTAGGNQIENIDLEKETSATKTVKYTINEAAGTDVTLTFIATDKGDATKTVTKTFTVESQLTQYTAIMMGAHQNAEYGSFFSVTDGVTLKVAEAKADPATVDFVYFHGTANQASIVAPNDTRAEDFNVYDVANWSVRNATKFSKVSTDFDAVASMADIESATESGVNMLEVGSVVAFETVTGEKGVFKVKTLDAGTDGYIEIDVKVAMSSVAGSELTDSVQ